MSGQNLFDPSNPAKSQQTEQTVPYRAPDGSIVHVSPKIIRQNAVGFIPESASALKAQTSNPFAVNNIEYKKVQTPDMNYSVAPTPANPAIVEMRPPKPPSQSTFSLNTDSYGLRGMLELMGGVAGMLLTETKNAAAPHIQSAVNSFAKSAKDTMSFTFDQLKSTIAPTNPDVLATPTEQLSGIKQQLNPDQQKQAAEVLTRIRNFKRQESTIHKVQQASHDSQQDIREVASLIPDSSKRAVTIKEKLFGIREVRSEDRKLINENMIAAFRRAQKESMQQSIASQPLPDTGSVQTKGFPGKTKKPKKDGFRDRMGKTGSGGHNEVTQHGGS